MADRPDWHGGKRMIALFAVTLFSALTACGRPLTETEKDFLSGIHGTQLNTRPIRFHDGNPGGQVTYQIPVRPRTTCQERIWPPQTETRTVTVSPGATALFHHVLFRKDLYLENYVPGWPKEIGLVQAMLLAHEATHIWQWQNRKRTGYTPLKALREHATQADPYLFEPDGKDRRFLDFGYEQQGAIVEEYVCCRLLDPSAKRTDRLRKLLSQELPISRLDEMLQHTQSVLLPWAGIPQSGICEHQPGT